ncbi:4Fe-4S binding protein [Myxococcota bacterium]|nr:4Fe-4S binding protein [Myxococcota bacterium]MBU1898704.1 4Fe-4S binding protein [Myxococcota bacterium]
MTHPRAQPWRHALAETLPVPAALLGFGLYLWWSTGAVFYLFNFGYIATAILVGGVIYERLPRPKRHLGRRLLLVLIGVYMFGYLGVVQRENMQIEGLWLYLLQGLFAGSVIHYLAAKLGGALLFGRGWCGWMCWTVMVLDFLPFRRSPGRLAGRWGWLRYAHLLMSLGVVALAWFILDYRVEAGRHAELWWLLAGNLLYWGGGVILAFALRDNRAFCKYLCPIPALQKIPARFSLMKIQADPERCDTCGACERVCPMDIELTKYIAEGRRILSTECILCCTCQSACPKQALTLSYGLDAGLEEHLRPRPHQTA